MPQIQFSDVGVVPQTRQVCSWVCGSAVQVMQKQVPTALRLPTDAVQERIPHISYVFTLAPFSLRLLLDEFHIFYVEEVPEPFAPEIWTFSMCSSYGVADGFSALFAPLF